MTAGMMGRVPNQPKTKQRTIRIPDEEWEAVKAAAEANGETVTDVARAAFKRYVQATERRGRSTAPSARR